LGQDAKLLISTLYLLTPKAYIHNMAVRRIIKMGNYILAAKAKIVEPCDVDELTILIPDMIETMRAEVGVGLAAPQIGVGLRVIVFEVPEDRATNMEGDQPFNIRVLINPKIDLLTDEKKLAWEGCLSIPDLRGEVPRYTKISYSGFDSEGAPISAYASGFHARVVQHEVDHLDGILYPERMVDMRRFGYANEFSKEPNKIKDEESNGNING
jgi:peptide deformylase